MRIIRTLSRLLLVGCIISVAAPFLVGQGERPQRGQGGGGPGGGRGFGGGGGFGGRGIASLLTIKEVRDELKMDEEQTKEMEAFAKELRDEMQSQFAGFGSGRGGPGGSGGGGPGGGGGGGAPDMTKINEAMAKMQLKSESKLGEVLDPIQMDRLVGLFIQRDGVQTLSSKIISTRLEITEDQKTKLADQEKNAWEGMRSLFGGGGGGGGDMREKMEKMRKESEEKISSVLTSAQKAKMDELKGAKFEFPAPPPRGGPGGGRGGNPQ